MELIQSHKSIMVIICDRDSQSIVCDLDSGGKNNNKKKTETETEEEERKEDNERKEEFRPKTKAPRVVRSSQALRPLSATLSGRIDRVCLLAKTEIKKKKVLGWLTVHEALNA